MKCPECNKKSFSQTVDYQPSTRTEDGMPMVIECRQFQCQHCNHQWEKRRVFVLQEIKEGALTWE